MKSPHLCRDRLEGFGDIGTQMNARARQAKVNPVISGQLFDIYFDVLANGNVPWPMIMSASALRDMDFVLDFGHQRMCFALHSHLCRRYMQVPHSPIRRSERLSTPWQMVRTTMRLKAISNIMGSLIGILVLGPLGCELARAEEAAVATASDANLDSHSAEGAIIQKITVAMNRADLKTVAEMYQSSSDPVVHALSAMAVERIHFNLDNATRDAALCQQTLADTRPRIALFCGQVEAGDLRLAGRYKEAIDKEAALVKQFESKGLDKQVVPMRNFVASSDVPQLSVERPAGTITLDLKQRADDDISSPTIKAKANGHSIDLIMDSGASTVVIGEDQARSIGVKLSSARSKGTSGWLSKGVPSKAGMLEELTFGGIAMHNVPVVVVPRDIALIGVNYLAPLGAIHISKSKMIITEDASDATCGSPMLVGTSVFGDYLRVLPQLSVEGNTETVLLDTGAHEYLLGSKKALDEVTALHRGKIGFGDIGTSMTANVKSAKVNLTISGQPFQVYFDVLSDSESLWPITLGAGALRDMDFVLDFNNRHTCFALHSDLH